CSCGSAYSEACSNVHHLKQASVAACIQPKMQPTHCPLRSPAHSPYTAEAQFSRLACSSDFRSLQKRRSFNSREPSAQPAMRDTSVKNSNDRDDPRSVFKTVACSSADFTSSLSRNPRPQ
ncbi:hypothetical protein Dimus_030102, partial [Dionaea muscipula]